MPNKSVSLSEAEYQQVEKLKQRLGLTDREVYFRGLGLTAAKRTLGRPKKRRL